MQNGRVVRMVSTSGILGYGFPESSLKAALERLPEAFREAVWLRDVEELTYQEIARILEIPVGTVMSRISRGRRQLVQQLTAMPELVAQRHK